MTIQSWFPTLISSEYIYTIDEKPLIKRAYEIEKKYPVNSKWNCETYTSINLFDLQIDDIFKPLIKIIKNKVLDFAKVYGIENCKIHKTESWINISKKGNYQEYHTHALSHFSAVFYLLTPKNCGDIVFQKGDNMFPLPFPNEPNAYNLTTSIYKAEQFNLLIFPSDLRHMVRTNMSDNDRISIALNFTLQDKE